MRSSARQHVWRNDGYLWLASAADAPRSFRVQYALGDVLFDLGRRREAIDAYERAIAAAPEPWTIRNDLARRLREIADDDEAIIEEAKRFVAERNIARDRFEFQMLYGVRRDLQDKLVRDGYRMRVYVPFGTQWYPYLMRRLAERPANVAFMTDLLDGLSGLALVSVPTAELGVELARIRRPALVIMDINLPGMSGLDALKVLRGWPETNGIPIIALTAAASDRDRERGERAGFYRYLTKPIDVDELERAIQRALV